MVRIAAPIALGLLVAGIAVAAWQWRRPQPAVGTAPPATDVTATTEPNAGALDEIDDTAVEQALRQEPGNAAGDDRDPWVNEVIGVDVAMLTPKQNNLFIRFANAARCTCGCGYTLAGCRKFDPSCEISYPILIALRDSVASGLIASAHGLRRAPSAARAAEARAAVDR